MFGWLKMAELCSSPFDGDDHYDVDVDTELHLELWKASKALDESIRWVIFLIQIKLHCQINMNFKSQFK